MKPLWTPSPERIANSNLTAFTRFVEQRTGQSLSTYDRLYNWSVDNIADFWESIWDYAKPIHSAPYQSVLENPVMPGAKWFTGSRLNLAENLLRYRDDRTAIIHWRENSDPLRLTFGQLYSQVARCAEGLKRLGVTTGDRVAAFIPNIPEAVIAMLATTSLGAVWSSCSPDFGIQGVLDRFGQIEPKILLTADGYSYNGKPIDSLARVNEIAEKIKAIRKVVVVPILSDKPDSPSSPFVSWSELLHNHVSEVKFEQLPFDHPVYIMYSSGTTGVPKCIVHGAGGALLQHYKEHVLHTDLKRDDIISYYTTCGWMMWNWLVSGLQVGATIFLYEGSPAWPDIDILWKAVEEEKITVFGTSPKYLSSCQNLRLVPRNKFDLTSLKAILSTGAPLTAQNFTYVYSSVKSDIQLSSISGGTDIVSCFMLGNPNLPVCSEEIQSRGLGMKVESFDDNGNSVNDQLGELVCTAPFPSMPVRFWNDPENSKYRKAYFDTFSGVWRHGDYIRITPRGGVVVYGRSDSTLNPGGVRIGTAEIYNPVEAMDEVVDSVVVGQRWKSDIRIVLFVVLTEGTQLTDDLKQKIRTTIRERATPRHLPKVILQVDDIPRTINGKKVEIAVTQIIHGEDVPNRDALANPDTLDQFCNRPELSSE